MIITRISLQNFRSYNKYSAEISPTTTIIIGPNGSGKTSIIEAIHVGLRGSSFRGSIQDILNSDKKWWRADIDTNHQGSITIKFNPTTNKPKQFVIKDRVYLRLPSSSKHPVVLFEPEDMRLIHGSPERRRRFIDSFITQIDPIYGTTLRKYERALKQRNALLKRQAQPDDLFVWNITLSDYGAEIIKQRTHYIVEINKLLQDIYSSIAKNQDTISIGYSSPYHDGTQQQLLRDLHKNTRQDTLYGTTSVGPHRHDILFEFNKQPASKVVSRGEARTIVLAMKLIEAKLLQAKTDKKPVILLDDVLSELDEKHQQALRDIFTANYQTIITGTHISWPKKGAKVIELS